MVYTSALYSQSQQDVLDTIRTQFSLSDKTVLDITKTFLREAAEGLAGYGQAMAMMYAFFIPAGQTRTNSSQSDVRQVGPRRFRDRVCSLIGSVPLRSSYISSALFWPLIWVVLICMSLLALSINSAA